MKRHVVLPPGVRQQLLKVRLTKQLRIERGKVQRGQLALALSALETFFMVRLLVVDDLFRDVHRLVARRAPRRFDRYETHRLLIIARYIEHVPLFFLALLSGARETQSSERESFGFLISQVVREQKWVFEYISKSSLYPLLARPKRERERRRKIGSRKGGARVLFVGGF